MSTPRNSGRPFELLIFDCDGVLVDSEVIVCRVEVQAFAEIGYSIELERFMERFIGKAAKDSRAIIEQELGRSLPVGFNTEVARRVAQAFARELKPVDGVSEALARLSNRKCVASSSLPDRLAYTLGLTGLAECFGTAIFSAAMVARGKPAPDLFLHAAEQMRVAPPHCLVIEDSGPGIIAAKTAGMTAFGFAGASHCRSRHAEQLTAAGADLVFSNMRELPAFIDRYAKSEE
ncbi:MAG TPA: HAD family hydrolase [Stellaceae bacterium]|nr:HAD family hydrolase [Stellaceae bacterium]